MEYKIGVENGVPLNAIDLDVRWRSLELLSGVLGAGRGIHHTGGRHTCHENSLAFRSEAA